MWRATERWLFVDRDGPAGGWTTATVVLALVAGVLFIASGHPSAGVWILIAAAAGGVLVLARPRSASGAAGPDRRWILRVAEIAGRQARDQDANSAERLRIADSVTIAFLALDAPPGTADLRRRIEAFVPPQARPTSVPADGPPGDASEDPATGPGEDDAADGESAEAAAERRREVADGLALRAEVLREPRRDERADVVAYRRLAAALWQGLEAMEDRQDRLRRVIVADAVSDLRGVEDAPDADVALLRRLAAGIAEHARAEEAGTTAWRGADADAVLAAQAGSWAGILAVRREVDALTAVLRADQDDGRVAPAEA